MTNCGCIPSLEPYRKIPIDDSPIITNSKVILKGLDDTCDSKYKIICEFYNILNQLKCGILPNLESLLLEILLIDINNE